MKIDIQPINDTKVKVAISADAGELEKVKDKLVKKLAKDVKVAGFREGKVPIEVAEKNIPADKLQSEFLDEAINTLYIEALRSERIRPISAPKAEVKAFVPYTQLDVELEVEVIGKIKLGNYKKFKAKPETAKIGDKEIKDVIENLRVRLAEKKDVKRAAKNGDEAWIDFKGVDAKGEPVKGADGKDYPLALGSKTFIPGFEDNVVGMKPGEEKTFDTTFPKNYGVKGLQNAKVKFTVTLKSVKEVEKPEVNDEFAAKVGPFKDISQLKEDIKKQLLAEKQQSLDRDYENAIIDEIVADTKIAIPDSLIEEQQQRVLQEVRQNAVQRGMTFEDYLKQRELSEADFIKKEARPEAKKRIMAGLVLSEIGDIEGIAVNDEEIDARIQVLKSQYPDQKMQAQLDNPEARREIASRLRAEKVIQFLKNQ